MVGEIIAVGEEVLSGDVVNSNAAYISRQLSELGVFCRYHTVVGDVVDHIVSQLEESSRRSQCIVLCGGLGPTKDDLTKDAVGKFLGQSLYEDAEIRHDIDVWFQGRHLVPTENNYKQARMIQGAIPLKNGNGTAPGVYYKKENVHIFLLPGPPGELIPMFEECVVPIMKKNIDQSIQTTTFRLADIGESQAVTILDDLMGARKHLIVAPYAKLREVHIKVTSIEESKEKNIKAMEPIRKIIRQRLGEYIYCEGNQELAEVIVNFLREKKKTLSVAESCTGGLVSDYIVTVPGASDVFQEGVITYSNQSKVQRLDVNEAELQRYGAVSEVVAKAMVKGVASKLNSDYAISVTGIAGPEGGTEEKPVGTVYIGIKTPETTTVKLYHFVGSRQKIREQSAKSALIDLLHTLKNN